MKADRQAPIGVFDSGVGGLTVVREIMRKPARRTNRIFWRYRACAVMVPNRKYRHPLFPPDRTLSETQQVKAIVIACNTASALALDTIEKEIDLPIIGVVKPGAQMAVETTQNKRVGVIANREHYSERPLPAAYYRGRSGDHRLRKTVSAVRAARGRGLDKRSDHRGSGAPLSGRDSG